MNRPISIGLSVAFLTLIFTSPVIHGQDPKPGNTWSQEDTTRIVNEVQKQIGSLPDYSVFDWITFGIQGKKLILKGYASRPILKDEVQRVVKDIQGIDSVDNQIEVLPLSTNDDRIRVSVYNLVYRSPALSKYNANQGGICRGGSVARMAGGITVDPPIGFHAIHIIVNNGHVTLYGAVLNSGDSTIAMMQANSAPGAFSVDNELAVEGTSRRSEKD